MKAEYNGKFNKFSIHMLSVHYSTISPFLGGPICQYWKDRYYIKYGKKQSYSDAQSGK